MRNSKKNRRGIAIELAILTLAITAIFCTIAVTTTLQESKFIKAELEDLGKKCDKLKYEKKDKATFKTKIQEGKVSQVMNPIPVSGNSCNAIIKKIYAFENEDSKTVYQVESWTWLNEEK